MMPESGLLDTLLNLSVFVFIGILVWMYQRPLPEDARDPSSHSDPQPTPGSDEQ
jgi:hypothetical protein